MRARSSRAQSSSTHVARGRVESSFASLARVPPPRATKIICTGSYRRVEQGGRRPVQADGRRGQRRQKQQRDVMLGKVRRRGTTARRGSSIGYSHRSNNEQRLQRTPLLSLLTGPKPGCKISLLSGIAQRKKQLYSVRVLAHGNDGQPVLSIVHRWSGCHRSRIRQCKHRLEER